MFFQVVDSFGKLLHYTLLNGDVGFNLQNNKTSSSSFSNQDICQIFVIKCIICWNPPKKKLFS